MGGELLCATNVLTRDGQWPIRTFMNVPDRSPAAESVPWQAPDVGPLPMDPQVQWQCRDGHVVHRSRQACLVCGALQADERVPLIVATADSSTPPRGSSSQQSGIGTTLAALGQMASEHIVIASIVVVLALGAVFSFTNAIGLTHTNEDEPARRSTTITRPSNEPSPSSQRAWLSPNQDGEDCVWMPGKASDYGDPWSFCNYPAS